MSTARYLIGDTRDLLADVPTGSVDLIVTSPPFLALRSYLPADHPDKHREIGSEPTPADFLSTLLALTVEWRRVLAPHGSLCVELGDTYSGISGQGSGEGGDAGRSEMYGPNGRGTIGNQAVKRIPSNGWPLAKSMCGIPTLYTWSLAYGRNLLRPEQTFAPWRIRNLIVWARPNPPVGALGDKFRPATSYITVACTSAKRWFDLDAVRSDVSAWTAHYAANPYPGSAKAVAERDKTGARSGGLAVSGDAAGKPIKSHGAPPLDWHTDCDDGTHDGDHLWALPTAPYPGSHFATYPPELPARLIQAMCPMQVCRVCGEPRRRIVEAERTMTGKVDPAWKQARSSVTGGGPMAQGATTTRETLGWTDCGHGDYRNGLTLDPFAGSGTTLAAATGAGRDALGFDLDPRNLDLARQRIGMFLVDEPSLVETETIGTFATNDGE